MLPPPPRCTLFPYTTLFRSQLRSQVSGHIIQISSIGGLVTGPMTGIYSASKFALEGFSESLAQEAAHFGVHVSIVEPGGYWTNLYLKMGHTKQKVEYKDRKSTRLNSSHVAISYAVFCLKKKKEIQDN